MWRRNPKPRAWMMAIRLRSARPAGCITRFQDFMSKPVAQTAFPQQTEARVSGVPARAALPPSPTLAPQPATPAHELLPGVRSDVASSGPSPPSPLQSRTSFARSNALERSGLGVGGPEPETNQAIINVRIRNNYERRAQTADIWKPFMRNFQACAPGCEPANYSGLPRRSIPAAPGRALDVHAMICGGRQTYKAINQGRFSQMVACMQQKGALAFPPISKNNHRRMIKGELVVLFQNGDPMSEGVTQAHYDHAHFSIGCYNYTYW